MNIQEYISSGILEAYALGDLAATERAEVEKNLAQYPALRQELTRIEEIQEALLTQAAVQPRASVRTKVFEAIDANENKVVPIDRANNLRSWKFAAAASIALAILTSYLAYDYRTKWKETEGDLTALIAQNQQVAQDYNRVNQRLDRMENDLKVLNNPEFKRVVMASTDKKSPDAKAFVYWNESSQEVYLSIQNMKALAQENQYQLWAIIDGKPVDAGVFDGTMAGLLKMKAIGKGATTFAVTIEPRGGKSSPTLETMQVAGNITKG